MALNIVAKVITKTITKYKIATQFMMFSEWRGEERGVVQVYYRW